MFFATGLIIRLAKYRLSMRIAVSKSTCAPSTIAASVACGAGYRPRVLVLSMAGATTKPPAIFGLLGVPPGIL